MEKNLDTSILDEKLFTLREAAKICRVSEGTIQKEIDEGNLSANKIRGQWRILERDFVEYFRRTHTKAKQARAL